MTADGHAAPGYRVTDETDAGPQSCTDVSPVGIDKNIDFCGISAVNTIACWLEAGGRTMLCLRDARKHVLARLTLDGTFRRGPPPEAPSPQVLELRNGVACTIRDGGAGTSPTDHPSWVEQYYCDDKTTLFGPPDSDGITRTGGRWTVRAYSSSAPRSGSVRTIRTAYLLGTAS